jgi:hypothetical protein
MKYFLGIAIIVLLFFGLKFENENEELKKEVERLTVLNGSLREDIRFYETDIDRYKIMMDRLYQKDSLTYYHIHSYLK